MEALTRAEAAARRRMRWALTHPVRHLRPTLGRLTRPTEVRCELFTGQRIDVVVPEIVGTHLYRFGYIEAPLTRMLLDHLRPGMVFVDVGAHYGYHSLVASLLVQPGGAVVALEPGRYAYRLLTGNAARARSIRTDPVAAHSEHATLALHDFGTADSALNTLFSTARVPGAERSRLDGRTYPVRCVTLDDHLDALGVVPDFVKIDAEGSELAILHGMTRTLRHAAPVVALEVGDYEGMTSPATARSIELLDGLGYRAFEYDGDGGLRAHRRRASYGYDNLFFVKNGTR